jgi:hypothetical protein
MAGENAVNATTATNVRTVSPTVDSANRISDLLSAGSYDKIKDAWKSKPQGVDQKSQASGLSGYQWNLPPHNWSLPVEPLVVAGGDYVVDTAKRKLGATDKYRRGRIYWYARVDNEYVEDETYNNGVNVKGGEQHAKDPRYGFQFLWNPTSVQTSVAMNMAITPSFADKFVDVVGAFPSGETLVLEAVIDRTNDFACIQSMKNIETSDKTIAVNSAAYYSPSMSFDWGYADTLVSKIQQLQQVGTIADIEYLYKAINGPGWTNSANGRKTSDIGFLRPTLLRIDLGPLSYLGYVNSLNVVHSSFNRAMVPISSTIAIQFNLMATAGLASK